MASHILKGVLRADDERESDFAEIDSELLSNEEDNNGSEEDVAHNKLIQNISVLSTDRDKSLKWKAKRFESSNDINEFNFNRGKEKIKISDLVKSIKNPNRKIKSLKYWDKKKLLEPNLEKPIAEKIKRKVAFEEVSKELSKWDSVVESNRNANQLQFPLNQSNLRLETAHDIVKRYAPKTKMEIEIDELLNKSENFLTEDKALTESEEKLLKSMNLEEAKLRLKELQRMRALLSYQEIKLKRQSRIKSKRYHRILKKDRLKKELTNFENEAKTNPDSALEKLKELDKLRALERASLKHKNTGKWAKHNKLRAKYDDNARQALADQIELSKNLTKKNVTNKGDESYSERENSEHYNDEEMNKEGKKHVNFVPVISDGYNPWLKNSNLQIQMNNIKEKLDKKENNDKEKLFKKKNSTNKWLISDKKVNEISSTDNKPSDDEPLIYETTNGVENDIMINSSIENTNANNLAIDAEEPSAEQESEQQSEVKIDPNKFITIKSHKLKSAVADMIINVDSENENDINDDSDYNDEQQRKLVSEAFADDDVIRNFTKEKIERVDDESEKTISLYLPGWGQWAGDGINASKRKQNRFTKRPKRVKRKDDTIGNVIISEKNEQSISKFQVNQLPFPFKNVVQFQNSIRQPIGKTWNPETAFRSLTQPKVLTKMGAIIKPMDSESLIKSNAKRPQLFKRNNKKKAKNVNK